MPGQHIFGHTGKTDPAEQTRGIDKGDVDQLGANAQCFKDLRATVAVKRADAHFAHHLEQPFVDSLDKVAIRLRQRHARGMPPFGDQRVNRFIHQVRMDRIRPITNQRGKVVDIAWLATFTDQAGAHAHALVNQVVMDGTDS